MQREGVKLQHFFLAQDGDGPAIFPGRVEARNRKKASRLSRKSMGTNMKINENQNESM
jgi:hypothetical protein